MSKEFIYTIKDKAGIHVRPAGMLVKEAARFSSGITIEKDGKTADVKKVFSLMSLGTKQNDTVTIRAEGEDEADAIAMVKAFFESNL